jgi:hypothetical protein
LFVVLLFFTLMQGSYFGELPFLFPATVKLQPFTATVMLTSGHSASNNSSGRGSGGGDGEGGGGGGHMGFEAGAVLHSISGRNLEKVFEWFPELREMMESVARVSIRLLVFAHCLFLQPTNQTQPNLSRHPYTHPRHDRSA